jgi:vanadium nitrogenase delta subunit
MDMHSNAEAIFNEIQEKCLWQFFSRAWDREENIDGILTKVGEIMAKEPSATETMADKYFYADAKVVAAELSASLPWLKDLDRDEVKAALQSVKEKLLDITVTRSLNGELRVKNY